MDEDDLILTGLWQDLSLPELQQDHHQHQDVLVAGAMQSAAPMPLTAAPHLQNPSGLLPEARGSLQPTWQPYQQRSVPQQAVAVIQQAPAALLQQQPSDAALSLSPSTESSQQQQQQQQPAQQQRKRAQRSQPTGDAGRRGNRGVSDITKQVSELEEVYQAKLEALNALAATHHELSEKAWVFEKVLAAQGAEAARLAELQSGQVQEPFQVLGVTTQQLKEMPPQQFLDALKTVTKALGEQLMAYELTGVVTPKLAKLQEAIMQGCKYMSIVRPDLVMYYSMHMDSVITQTNNAGGWSSASVMESMPHATEDHWQRVAAALKLTPEALARCHILAQLVKGWQERIQAERRALIAALNQCRATGAAGVSSVPSASDLLNSVSAPGAAQAVYQQQPSTQRAGSGSMLLQLYTDTPPEEPILARLSANLEKEKSVLLVAGEVMWGDIFTEMESCRVLVHSYPYVPDDFSLLNALSQLHTQTTFRG